MTDIEVELNHSLFKNIDSENKAYTLGWIFGLGIVSDKEIVIGSNNEDYLPIIKSMRDFVCPQLIIDTLLMSFSFTIKSEEMAKDALFHFNNINQFIDSIKEEYKCVFIRGIFDSCGTINYSSCFISSCRNEILFFLDDFFGTDSCIFDDGKCTWKGSNCLDFLAKIYKNATIYYKSNYDSFITIANSSTILNTLPRFKWARTIPNAPAPEKNRFSDSGYDLHIIKKIKVVGGVHYYDTGIQVQPENGYYFDLVGRSSISKTGWMLANNIGIIDISYIGTIIVALVKVDPSAHEITLPCRLVQLIPRRLILMEPIEVESLEKTERGDKGFGSSK
jgi:dUTP pyrophosphatase